MNNKGISFDKQLKETVLSTVELAAKAIKSTLGPSGTNVGVRTQINKPNFVNDGVTVAKNLRGLFPQEETLKNYIIEVVISTCENTERLAGDGTTTTATLLEAIVTEGYKVINAGYSPVEVVNGIKLATEDILAKLNDSAITVSKENKLLKKIATISSNNDEELGGIIYSIFSQIGENGKIDTKHSNSTETRFEVIDGVRYNSGMQDVMFSNTTKTETILDDCHILIYEGKLKDINPIFDTLNAIKKEDESVLIIADEFAPAALESLTSNKVMHKFKVCAVRSPGFGIKKENDLNDIAFMTGATVISSKNGEDKENVTMDKLGKASSVKVTLETFTLLCENRDRDASQKRIDQLKEELKAASGTDKEELLDRIAKLSDGIGIIYIGGASPEEVSDKEYRIEDAVNATRVAIEEGIVPGGGVSLLKLAQETKPSNLKTLDEELGYNLLLRALEAPIRTICENSGTSADLVVNNVLDKKNFNYGYNAKTKKYGDLIKNGVVDPKKVTRVALQNASSIGRLILSTNCIVH